MNVLEFLDLRVKTDEIRPAEGASLGDDAAMLYFKAAATDTAIGYVADSIASCEMRVMVEGEPKRGDLYRKLNLRPNPVMSAYQLKVGMIYRLMTMGEALIVPVGNGLYLADGFNKTDIDFGRATFENVTVSGFQIRRRYGPGEAIYLTFGNQRVKRLVDGMFESYAKMMGSAVDGYQAGAGTKWKLTVEQGGSGDRRFNKAAEQQRNDPREMLQTFIRGANAVYFETRGQELKEIDVKGCPSDDLIKIRKDAFELVASIYKIPQSMLFGNMTNLDEITRVFLTFTVKPLAKQISEELTSKLFDPLEWYRGSEVVVDTSRIKYIDIFDSAPSVQQLLGAGYSMDELREYLNQPTIGTEESKQHLITRNFGPIDEVLRQVIQKGGEK